MNKDDDRFKLGYFAWMGYGKLETITSLLLAGELKEDIALDMALNAIGNIPFYEILGLMIQTTTFAEHLQWIIDAARKLRDT